MKKLFIILGATVLISCAGSSGPPAIKKIVAVEPHHATRVFIIYQAADSLYYADTYHWSGKIIAGSDTVDPSDYLNNTKPYGPLPGREKDYEAYKKQIEKK